MRVDEMLIRNLFDELDPRERRELNTLLSTSPELLAEYESMETLIEHYRRLGEEEPPSLTLPVSTVTWRRPTAIRVIAAAVLVLVAFGAGRVSTLLDRPTPDQLFTLRAEALALRREVARLALEQAEVAERIRASDRVAALASRDNDLSRVLHRVLRDDPNPNVRLAVIDGMYDYPVLAPAPAQLVEIFRGEPEMMQRLALLEWLVDTRPEGWRRVLDLAEEDRSEVIRRFAREQKESSF